MTEPEHNDEKPRPAPKSAAQEKSDASRSRAGSRASSGSKKKRTPEELALLARVFGETLPATTTDERTPEPDSGGSSEDWLRRQVPPHHG